MVEQEQKKAFRTNVLRAGFRCYDLFGKQKEGFTNGKINRIFYRKNIRTIEIC